MQFTFAFDNHKDFGRDSIYDILDAIAGQLRDLGHQCDWHTGGMDGLRPGCPLVIVEGFGAAAVEKLKEINARGARIVIIATERPGRPGFNDSKAPELVERQRWFPVAARQAAAVWCLVPGVARWARQWCPHSIDLELGWSAARETHLRPRFGADDAALYDFSFYGSMTDRRRNIIAALERRGYMVITSERNTVAVRSGVGAMSYHDQQAISHARNASGFLTLDNRNSLIGSAKVVLGIHQYPGWRLVSNSRFATALSLGRPVINEPPPRDVETPWREVGVFSRSVGSFVDEAIAMLDRWQEARDQQVARFRETFASEHCVGEAVRLTLPEIAAAQAA